MLRIRLPWVGILTILFAIDVVLASPKVLGLDFQKGPRPASSTDKLRRRQNSVATDIINAELCYIINVSIGKPPQPIGLQLDTGSSDTWVPDLASDICSQGMTDCSFGAFDVSQSTTAEPIDSPSFDIAYVDESKVSGTYFTDTLTMGSTKVSKMQMGLAETSPGRDFGVLGIGFTLGESIVETDPNEEYPNFINQLKNQGYINTLAYSLWLNDLESSKGSILFGGVDTEKYVGDLTVIPIQPDEQSGTITSMTVVLSSISVTNTDGDMLNSRKDINLAVVLDCGSTDTILPDDIVQPILSGVGAVQTGEDEYYVPCSLGATKATFTFTFGASNGPAIAADISQFVRPIVTPDGSALTFDDGQEACAWGLLPSGSRPSLFGDTFLRSAYVVYDLETAQIAMAQTKFNTTTSNIVEFSNKEIPKASATVSGVQVIQTFTGIPIATGDLVPTHEATQVGGNLPSPTFNLKGVAMRSRPPGFERVTLVAGVVCLVSFLLGLSLV